MSLETRDRIVLAVFLCIFFAVVIVWTMDSAEREGAEIRRQERMLSDLADLKRDVAAIKLHDEDTDWAISVIAKAKTPEEQWRLVTLLSILRAIHPCIKQYEQPVKSDAERESASGGVR